MFTYILISLFNPNYINYKKITKNKRLISKIGNVGVRSRREIQSRPTCPHSEVVHFRGVNENYNRNIASL